MRATTTALKDMSGLDRVKGEQYRLDLIGLRDEIKAEGEGDFAGLRRAFVQNVSEYSRKNGLTREAWLAAGIPAADLDIAHMTA